MFVLILTFAGESVHVATVFTASVSLLYHPKEIFAGFRTTVHVGNVRQTAVIEKILPSQGMKSNETATVEFRLVKYTGYPNTEPPKPQNPKTPVV